MMADSGYARVLLLMSFLVMVLYPTVTQGKQCKSAIEQLTDYNRDYGQFVAWERSLNATNHAKWFYKYYQSVAPLRKGDPSAVIIFPTNAAFMKWLGKNNIHSDPSSWMHTEIKRFRKASMAMVIPWRVARKRWPKYFTGCTLLGLTHDLNFPLEKMGLDLWSGKGPGLTGSLLPQKTTSTPVKGRRLQGTANPGFFYQDYSIAGTGYNTLTGFPLQFTGNDPGITGNSVFNTGKGGISVATVQNYATCGINFATTTYYTAAELQGAAITSLQVPSRYASAAFSQNSDYGSLANNMAANYMITLVQDSIVTGGGWNLGPITSSTNPLDSNYVMAVNNLATAKLNSSSSYNTLLSNFANSYGSTYVQEVWWGGYTSTVLQYSASNYASMQQAGVSLSSQALGLFYSAGGYIITSGCFPYNSSAISTAFQDASAYRVMQVPYASPTTNTLSAIPVSSSGAPGSTYSTGCSGGSIDCTGWTQNIIAQQTQLGIQAPNSYFLGDQYTLLTTYPNLFDPSISSVLPAVASDLANLFSKCQSLAPCPAPNSCPPQPASFAYSGSCVLCYDNTDPNSPLCTNSPSCGFYTSCSIGQCNCPVNTVTAPISVVPVVPPPQSSSPPSSCFPASATVLVAGGSGSGTSGTYSKEMKNLKIGDRVLASRPDGSLFYDEIYMFGHKERSQRATFVRLETDSGHILTLTPDHHVFVVRNNSLMEIPAGKAVVTDQVRVVPQSGALQDKHMSLQSIVSISLSEEKGLYNPYTLSGTIVVNGILASVHSSSAFDQLFNALGITLPFGYQTLFTPVRLLYIGLGAEKMASLEWIIDGAASVMNQPPHWVGHLIATLGISIFGFGLKRILSGHQKVT